jgi:hypothetical protein
MTSPTNAEVVAAWADSLTSWTDGRLDAEFTDPSTGEVFVFTVTRSAAKPACGDRERKLIRARGEAMRDLVMAHGPEFGALLEERLRELESPR